MAKIFLKSVLTLFILLAILFILWYSDVGQKKLYYIQEVNLYIKTFPSRETTIIAFSDERINGFSDSLDYIKVYKGNDYWTGILLNPNNKNIIHIVGNSLKETHWKKYKGKKEKAGSDCYEYKGERGYLLKYPYIGISFILIGGSEEVFSRSRENYHYTEIKPIN